MKSMTPPAHHIAVEHHLNNRSFNRNQTNQRLVRDHILGLPGGVKKQYLETMIAYGEAYKENGSPPITFLQFCTIKGVRSQLWTHRNSQIRDYWGQVKRLCFGAQGICYVTPVKVELELYDNSDNESVSESEDTADTFEESLDTLLDDKIDQQQELGIAKIQNVIPKTELPKPQIKLESKKTVENRVKGSSPGAIQFVDNPLCPAKSFLEMTPTKPKIERTETYPRNGLSQYGKNDQPRFQIPNQQQGDRAHLGDVINPIQSSGDSFSGDEAIHATTPGDAGLYDRTLKYKANQVRYIAEQCGKLNHFIVGAYNEYTCVMVFIKFPVLCKLTEGHPSISDTSKKAWTEVVISLYLAILNESAFRAGIPIECLRRSSFSFDIPTICETGQSFRLNVGLIPKEYADVIVASLKTLDEVLSAIQKDHLKTKPSNKTILRKEDYKNYVGKNSIYHKAVLDINSLSLMQLLWAKIERGPGGKTLVHSLLRTAYARLELTSKMVHDLHSKKGLSSREVLDSANHSLNHAIDNFSLKTKGKTKSLSYDQWSEADLDYPFSFNDIEKIQKIEDPNFWDHIDYLLNRLEQAKIPIVEYEEKLEQIRALRKKSHVTDFYKILEEINGLIFLHAADTKGQHDYGDGYGSDSDEEAEIEISGVRKKLYAKKTITHNGMRSILTTLSLIREKYYKLSRMRIFAKTAYYETPKGIDLLSKISTQKDASGNMEMVRAVSEANVIIYDLNACITDGRNHGDYLSEIKKFKTSRNIIIIFDATSATTEQCQQELRRIMEYDKNFKLAFFVSSGLKNQQMSSDRNHYGDIRIISTDKKLRDELHDIIRDKKLEPPIRSAISHAHRRLHKRLGNVPTNRLILSEPSKQELQSGECKRAPISVSKSPYSTFKPQNPSTTEPTKRLPFFQKKLLIRPVSPLLRTDSNKRFKLNPAAGNGDCGYIAYGIERKSAHQLIKNNIPTVSHLLAQLMHDALLNEDFVDYIVEKTGDDDIRHRYDLYVSQEDINSIFDIRFNHLFIEHYINFDIKERRVDNGWAHPLLLQCIAQIEGVHLVIWEKSDATEYQLKPHNTFHEINPNAPNGRRDIVYNGQDHFDGLQAVQEPAPVPNINSHFGRR